MRFLLSNSVDEETRVRVQLSTVEGEALQRLLPPDTLFDEVAGGLAYVSVPWWLWLALDDLYERPQQWPPPGRVIAAELRREAALTYEYVVPFEEAITRRIGRAAIEATAALTPPQLWLPTFNAYSSGHAYAPDRVAYRLRCPTTRLIVGHMRSSCWSEVAG